MAGKSSGKGAPPPPPSDLRGPGPRRSTDLSVKARTSGGSLESAAAALKKVAPGDIHDSSTAHAHSSLASPDSFKDYQAYVQLFNIECWLEKLDGLTFPTSLVELTREEGEALRDLHECQKTDAGTSDAAASERLQALAERLDAVMAGFSGGCMVKTSSRSAKDAPEPAELRQRLRELFVELGSRDDNAAMVALSYASMAMLRMRCAQQVLQIFLRSERLWNDMHLALSQEAWTESVACRDWVHLEPDMEFRCFVARGRFTCATQYRHLCFFPRLLALRPILEPSLVAFVERDLLPRLAGVFPDDNYIVDAALELTGGSASNILHEPSGVELGRWWCIEVNPFFETTDSGLFSWTRERELLEGRRPDAGFELRLQERPKRGALALVYGAWQSAIQEVLASNG